MIDNDSHNNIFATGGTKMLRFSANISMLFCERPFPERFAAARAAGFDAVEMQFPYDMPVEDIAAAREAAGIEFVVFNLPVGDMTRGGPGLAAMPGREADFAAAVEEGRRYAQVLAPRNINVLAGWPPADVPRQRCFETLARNLRLAAEVMAGIGVRVTVEAVNTRDRPGYFLTRTDEAVAAIEAADHPNLGLEHDLYHMQIMEGDLIPTLARHCERIAHIQFADTPGRHEPGTGEINFANVFAAIEEMGYDGWLGAEYRPCGRTEDSLGWMQPWL